MVRRNILSTFKANSRNITYSNPHSNTSSHSNKPVFGSSSSVVTDEITAPSIKSYIIRTPSRRISLSTWSLAYVSQVRNLTILCDTKPGNEDIPHHSHQEGPGCGQSQSMGQCLYWTNVCIIKPHPLSLVDKTQNPDSEMKEVTQLSTWILSQPNNWETEFWESKTSM